MKRIPAYITAILTALLIWGCDDDVETAADPVLRAIPTDASVIITTSDIVSATDKIKEGGAPWEDIKLISQFRTADAIFSDINTILKEEDKLRSDFRNKHFAISFHNMGNKINALVVILAGKKSAQTLFETISRKAKEKDVKVSAVKYDNVPILNVKPENYRRTIYYAYFKEFVLMSYTDIYIQNAIRQLKEGPSIATNKPLDDIITLKGDDAEANIIINYPKFYETIGTQLNANKRSVTKRISKFAEWSVLDISAHNQSVTMTGFSSSKDKSGAYINIFNRQSPVSNSFEDYIPSKTIQFASIGISDMDGFKISFKKYLDFSDHRNDYDVEDNANTKKYKINFEEEIYKIISKRITEFTTDYSIATRANDNYIIAETDDEDLAKKTLLNIVTQYQKKNNKQESEIATPITTQNGKRYTVYFFPIKNLFSTYFGEIFGTMDYSYLAIYNSKLIFAQNVNAVKEYINAVETGKTLANNSYYSDFRELVNGKSNIYYYSDLAYNRTAISDILNQSNRTEYQNNYGRLKNFRSAALQVSKIDKRYYTNAVIKYSDVIEAERLIKWKTELDSTAIIKPQIVRNFETGENNILVQDESRKVYLIDKNGLKMWKKQLPEPIIGQVYQVDIYRNNKIQYLFATENFIHCLDKNGNYLDNYPVEIKGGISSEISVFDYENDGNYRIFVPCNNKKLYLYTKNGTPLDTWSPVETKDKIITPVQYLRYKDNEYLVFADNLKTYILNRRGEPKIVPTKNFPKAPKSKYYIDASLGENNMRFVTTNAAGEIEFINNDGSSGNKNIKNYSINHNFVMDDINGDGQSEYIYTEGNSIEIYDSRYQKIGDYYTDGDITGRPIVFKFGGSNVKIGITCEYTGKAYLLDNKCRPQEGFPINGITEFSITKFGNSADYSLLIGNKDKYLYNYTIK
ncbi:MAG: hypothetical protein J5882_03610 [Bacteroidales bacterium]|nr:hypothetical protein [Bacteroidales bacterium]